MNIQPIIRFCMIKTIIISLFIIMIMAIMNLGESRNQGLFYGIF